MARPPSIDQRLYIFGILRHGAFAYNKFTPKALIKLRRRANYAEAVGPIYAEGVG